MKQNFFIIILIFISISIVGYVLFKKLSHPLVVKQSTLSTPLKTDFGTILPPNFPTNIPVETRAKIVQSYSLDYTKVKQLTIVLHSAKTIKENYTAYSSFLSNGGWNITNTYDSENISFLYARNGTNEINITLTKGEVSISIAYYFII